MVPRKAVAPGAHRGATAERQRGSWAPHAAHGGPGGRSGLQHGEPGGFWPWQTGACTGAESDPVFRLQASQQLVAALVEDVAASGSRVRLHLLHVCAGPCLKVLPPPLPQRRQGCCPHRRRLVPCAVQAAGALLQHLRPLVDGGAGCAWQAHVLQLQQPLPSRPQQLRVLTAYALLRKAAQLDCSGAPRLHTWHPALHEECGGPCPASLPS